MEAKKPIKLYLLITLVLLIAFIYFGMVLKNFLMEKFSSKDKKETEEIVKEVVPERVRQSKAILSVGVIIFIILVFIFVIFKIATRKN